MAQNMDTNTNLLGTTTHPASSSSSMPPIVSHPQPTSNMRNSTGLQSQEQNIADGSTAASSPAFHRFKDLAPELRNMIWRFAFDNL